MQNGEVSLVIRAFPFFVIRLSGDVSTAGFAAMGVGLALEVL
jgi:hypothetical protein